MVMEDEDIHVRDVQVVTGIFNLSREFDDGRTLNEYLTWLEGTLKKFPDTVVFADFDITQQIIAAARPLGIEVHDHLIIGAKRHFSFKSKGII
jgi:hypothetical protein